MNTPVALALGISAGRTFGELVVPMEEQRAYLV